MTDGGFADLQPSSQWKVFPGSGYQTGNNYRAADARQQVEPPKPYPVDWRFLPEELLVAKDWLRAKWIDAVAIEVRSPEFQRFWGTTLARHLLKPVIDSRVLFVHVPRTAGTSISSQLYGRNLPHWTAQTWKGVLGPRANGIRSFSILRDPTDRLVSLFRFIQQRGTKLMAAPRYDPYDLHSATDFGDFLDRLWGAEADRGKPVHLRPQVHCVAENDGSVAVDRLFAFSAVHGLPLELGRWLDLPAVPHLNASRPQQIDLPASLLSRIEQHYAADFELYARVEASGGMLVIR